MGTVRQSDVTGDPFAPKTEADAYRVTLYMSAFPEERVVHTVLRVGDDASVSFAKDWLHYSQPQPLISGILFDAWRVEKFIEVGVYENIGEGLADGPCRWSRGSWRTFRKRIEERSGASDFRNGLWSIDAEITPRRKSGRRKLAQRGSRGGQRSTRALTPFQEKMKAIREEAQRRVREKPREQISETQRRWRELVANARPNRISDNDHGAKF